MVRIRHKATDAVLTSVASETFVGADLRQCVLCGADLDESDLRGADLNGALLSGAACARPTSGSLTSGMPIYATRTSATQR
jgi:uncharacterized protein YjbI with pentapeptide repeats